MLRPVIDPPEEAREALLDVMEETCYPYTAKHIPIIENAFVVSIIDEERNVLAGYMWFYRLEEDEQRFSLHLVVLPEYRKRFFSRTLVNSILSLIWVLGCDTLVVENTNKDMLVRIGGYMNSDDEAELPLPHEWR